MSTTFMRYLRTNSAETISRRFLAGDSPFTRTVFGRRGMPISDLLSLARVDNVFAYGVDVGVATRDKQPVGVYVGVSTSVVSGGIVGRVREHKAVSRRPLSTLPPKVANQKHYKCTSSPDVTPNFRALELYPMDCDNWETAMFAEAIMMAYLNTPVALSAKSICLLDETRYSCAMSSKTSGVDESG